MYNDIALSIPPYYQFSLIQPSVHHDYYTGGVRHEIRPIRMLHLYSDFRARKESFSEVYVVKFSR